MTAFECFKGDFFLVEPLFLAALSLQFLLEQPGLLLEILRTEINDLHVVVDIVLPVDDLHLLHLPPQPLLQAQFLLGGDLRDCFLLLRH
jgi:hypothetical protein